MKTKKCSKCKQEKPLSEYHKKTGRKDGLKSSCKDCCREYAKLWWAESGGENGHWRKYYQENKERILDKQKQWRSENPDKSRRATREWANRNRDAIAERRSRRRATHKNATPSWLTEEQRKQIKDIYSHCFEMEKLTGVKHHVDHIHPLTHPLLCGLHVPWNLQVITAQENLSKGNRLQIDVE